jgi:dihydrofolate synthase/folylpolyglutamate synthase
MKRVGIYTSPHFNDYRERIKIGSDCIPEEDVIAFVNDHYNLIMEIKPSFFEITVAMAFWWFKEQQVDIAIIETGLGGRLDSTNIVHPLLSVITNISYDHQDFLGESLEEIATEKAGIIKNETPVVIGRFQEETHNIFVHKTTEHCAELIYSQDIVSVNPLGSYGNLNQYKLKLGDEIFEFETDLLGSFQTENISTAIAAYEILLRMELGLLNDYNMLLIGLHEVGHSLSFRGRWQVLGREPLVIADGAHNLEAIKKVSVELEKLDYDRLILVLGFVKEKDVEKLLRLFPQNALFFLTQASIPRALPLSELVSIADRAELDYEAYISVSLAYNKAIEVARPNDVVFVGGSLYVLAEIL